MFDVSSLMRVRPRLQIVPKVYDSQSESDRLYNIDQVFAWLYNYDKDKKKRMHGSGE